MLICTIYPDTSFSVGSIIACCTLYERSFSLHLCQAFASRIGTKDVP